LHHHATLCIAAYGFLISERETIPPLAPRATALFQAPAGREDHKPRGSATASRTAHSKLDCDHASKAHPRPRQKSATTSMLRCSDQIPAVSLVWASCVGLTVPWFPPGPLKRAVARQNRAFSKHLESPCGEIKKILRRCESREITARSHLSTGRHEAEYRGQRD